MNSAEVETIKKFYAALNSYDVTAYMSFFDAKIKRFETFGSSCEGLEELKDNFLQGRGTWAEGSCEPEQFTEVNGKIVVSAHVKVRQKNKTEWIDGYVTDVFVFDGLKVIEFNSFADRDEALKWATQSPNSAH